MMVVGLHSGKELFVQDDCYTLESPDGTQTHIFIGDNRMYTVKAKDIEFFDESATKERTDVVKQASLRQRPVEQVGMEYA